MKVLVLGATGMLGNAVFRQFSHDQRYQIYGTLRNSSNVLDFPQSVQPYLISNVDLLNQDILTSILARLQPEVVINCVGLIKQLSQSKDPLAVLPINAMLPHRLAQLCALCDARLIHVSTDCVFSGRKGLYTESDISDAEDLYGKSKYIGEIHDLSNVVTLRTSIIGHGITCNSSLIDWFLSQKTTVKGYTKAIFSGLPTVELARVIQDHVIPNHDLQGLYHVSSAPIDKLSLLKIVAEIYQKNIDIVPDNEISIDRSLNSDRFKQKTGYEPPTWPELIQLMYSNR
jgi:dTDP-4-dehydrorhamnose reductase